jgi:hypothetical protein
LVFIDAHIGLLPVAKDFTPRANFLDDGLPPTAPHTATRLSEYQESSRTLAWSCKALADRLITLIENLKVDGQYGTWKAFIREFALQQRKSRRIIL